MLIHLLKKNAVKYNERKYNERNEKKYSSIDDTVKILNQKYQMNPLVSFLSVKENSFNNIKVCEVFDLNWFPSLLPKTFSESTYNFVESVTDKKLDRKCTYIPFP